MDINEKIARGTYGNAAETCKIFGRHFWVEFQELRKTEREIQHSHPITTTYFSEYGCKCGASMTMTNRI